MQLTSNATGIQRQVFSPWVKYGAYPAPIQAYRMPGAESGALLHRAAQNAQPLVVRLLGGVAPGAIRLLSSEKPRGLR